MGKGIEGLNQYYEKAIKFQEKLEEKLGVNIEESMKYQALFNSMSKSMGISANYAYKLSENFTKLGYDLASLYNIEPEKAMDKLRAGLAGQTKPLRDLGLDITQQSLAPIAQGLGIEKSVKNMSQAEKMILRYIAVLKQAQIAQGDFANTMESPANQLRVFNAQITAFKRNMGNLWQGILGGILPYVNATMMVINELLKMIGKLFGFEMSSSATNLSAAVGIDDLSDGLGTAADNAKKLKLQLMGFDEIHNIDLNKQTSGSGGGASIGGIDQRLLDAMSEYDNMMDKVKSKATDIRDKMLAWLGFHRTDEGGWEMDKGLTNAEKLLDVAKAIGLTILGWKVSSGLAKFLATLGIGTSAKNLSMALGLTLTITGLTLQFQGTDHILNGDVDLFTILETAFGTASGAFGIATLLKNTALGKNIGFGRRLELGLGIMVSIQGVQVITKGIQEDDIKQKVYGALETGLGAGVSMSSINGLGYGVKFGILATIASIEFELGLDIVKWWNKYWDYEKQKIYHNKIELNLGEMLVVGFAGIGEGTINLGNKILAYLTGNGKLIDSMKEIEKETKEVIKSYKDFEKQIDKKKESNEVEIQQGKTLANQLYELVDANGKVKIGYESRADFIIQELDKSFDLELKRDGDVIKKNDEIIGSQEALREAIDKTIEKRKQELEVETYQEIYKDALKQKITLENQLNRLTQKRKELVEELNQAQQSGDLSKYATLKTTLSELDTQIATTSERYKDSIDTMNQADLDLTNSMIATTGTITSEMIQQGQLTSDTLQKMARDNETSWKESFDKLDEDSKKAMLEQSTIVGENAPAIIDKWKELASGSYEEFKSYIDQVEPEVQETLLTTLTLTEGMSPNLTKAWSDMAQNSEQQFNERIMKTAPDLESTILAGVTKTQGLTPQLRTAWANLAGKSKEDFDNGIKDLPEDTQGKILATIAMVQGENEAIKNTFRGLSEKAQTAYKNEISKISQETESQIRKVEETGRKPNLLQDIYNAYWGVGSRAYEATKESSEQNGGSFQLGNWFVSGFKNALSDGVGTIWNAAWNLGTKALNALKQAQDSHSPSKETNKLGQYFTQGFALGIVKEDSKVEKATQSIVGTALDELEKINTEGFKINAQDLSIDTNQYVNYGQIQGAIATQVNVNSNIPEQVYKAVIAGMQNVSIPVEIEAKTDEGVIFTKIQTKANEFAKQTGENPFPVLA